MLAPNSETLFAKELSALLVSLEAASPGFGMEMACILVGKASEVIIRNGEISQEQKKRRRLSHGSFCGCLIDGPHSSWRVHSVGLLCGVVFFALSI
jgi:hypothetical protein